MALEVDPGTRTFITLPVFPVPERCRLGNRHPRVVLKDLIDLVSQLEARGIGLKSLHESIDTTPSSGKLIFHVFGALAEFERNLIRERTQAGLAAARARGRTGGRPKSLDAAKRAIAANLYDEKQHSVKEICEVMGVSNPTLYKYIQAARTETT